jgi:sec-independent protein translocase protein TatA
MGSISLTHILIVVVVLVIFFGPNKLPQLGQSIGKSIKGFKKGLRGEDDESRDVTEKISSKDKDNP